MLDFPTILSKRMDQCGILSAQKLADLVNKTYGNNVICARSINLWLSRANEPSLAAAQKTLSALGLTLTISSDNGSEKQI
jgi:hypothetical protein